MKLYEFNFKNFLFIFFGVIEFIILIIFCVVRKISLCWKCGCLVSVVNEDWDFWIFIVLFWLLVFYFIYKI